MGLASGMTKVNNDGRTTGAKPSAQPRLGASRVAKPGSPQGGELPGWTNGLRQLYDQVVDEDLPDSFRDLLARLDDKN